VFASKKEAEKGFEGTNEDDYDDYFGPREVGWYTKFKLE
jgi:hypothetical protein